MGDSGMTGEELDKLREEAMKKLLSGMKEFKDMTYKETMGECDELKIAITEYLNKQAKEKE